MIRRQEIRDVATQSSLSAEEVKRRFKAADESETTQEAADRLGLQVPTLRWWLRTHYPRYEEVKRQDVGHLSEMERQERIRALDESETITKAARRLCVHPSTLAQWSAVFYPDHDRFDTHKGRRGPVPDDEAERRLQALEGVVTVTQGYDEYIENHPRPGEAITRGAFYQWARGNVPDYETRFGASSPVRITRGRRRAVQAAAKAALQTLQHREVENAIGRDLYAKRRYESAVSDLEHLIALLEGESRSTIHLEVDA